MAKLTTVQAAHSYGVLDPLGAAITPGAGAYQQLLSQLSKDLKACLAG